MIKGLERTFALSEKGARDLVKGFIACAVHNLTLFVPVGILYLLASDMMMNTLAGRGLIYAALCIISVALIMISYRWVYKATYFSTYVESGVRRVSLAEKLRKIPLSYFGKKDLADITSTIMADAATLETGLSTGFLSLLERSSRQRLHHSRSCSSTGGWDLQLFGLFPLPS